MKVLIADSNEVLLDNFTKVLQTCMDQASSKSIVTIGLSGMNRKSQNVGLKFTLTDSSTKQSYHEQRE